MNNDINFALNKINNLVQDVGAYYLSDIQTWIDCNFMEKDSIDKTSEILKNLARKNGLNNKTFTTDIKNVCNKMAEELLQELKKLISPDPFLCFITALAFFNRHLSLTYEIFFWYKTKHTIDADNSEVQKQLDFYFSTIENHEKFNELFYKLQCHIASEKFLLRLLLEICYDNLLEVKTDNQPQLYIDKILDYSRALGKIIIIRDQVSKAIGCVKELNFDIEGQIYFKQEKNLSFYSVGNKFLNWTTSKEYIDIPDEIIEKLNPLCNKFIGFSIKELFDLIDSLCHKYSSQSGSIIMFLPSDWENELKTLTNKNEIEINKLLQFISREPNKNADYLRNKKNKLLQKSVFFYKGTAIISINLLISSLMSLINDVFYNNIELKEFNIELEKIHTEINEEFEVEIYELLKNSLSKKILYNFTKIGSKPPFIEPPGQIDILLYYQYNLYVIECKNYDLKTNISSVANEVKRIQNDEIGKLEKKVRFVKENLRSILPLIGVDILEADSIENVTGLFVTKNFSVGELLTNQLPIINYSSLIDWIKSKNEF